MEETITPGTLSPLKPFHISRFYQAIIPNFSDFGIFTRNKYFVALSPSIVL